METLIKNFKDLRITDVPIVGGKNASLGEMFNQLSVEGVRVPDGFATTSKAFWLYLNENKLEQPLKDLLKSLDRKDFKNLQEVGAKARKLILEGKFSNDFSKAIEDAYLHLQEIPDTEVAVRSSATAEDLPEASFAGQHDTFLNVRGKKALLQSIKQCFASLYTDRAIKYREDKSFAHHDIALSVGVQLMVRADKGCSGVGFTIEPESGFENVILLSGVWGLGENIVQGIVNPDEFYVFKPTLEQGKNAIIQKKLGNKEMTMIYAESNGQAAVTNIPTKIEKQNQFILTDAEVLELAKWALIIEKHYKKSMDIEWAKDGITNKLYITQARPETVHTTKTKNKFTVYKLKEKGDILAKGNAIGSKIIVGTARMLDSPKDGYKLLKGDILISENTSPDWDPLLKKAGGVITNRGGRTSHAAIVARELGVPAVVGTDNATQTIKDGETITLSCAEGKTGFVYRGILKYNQKNIDFGKIYLPQTEAKFILSDPEKAFQLAMYPNNGVGLLRIEFIVTHKIKIHPMALVNFDKLEDKAAKKEIEILTKKHPNKPTFFVNQLAEGIATIAAAFYPKEVIVRMSDFKTNEYANLIGGSQFEPKEENPMIGFRGAARYYNKLYKDGFALECQAIKKVREEMGLTNVKVMIPFCRTLEEGKNVIESMAKNKLVQGENNLEVYMMVEIPSNVILAEEFADIFDGFSIGSNDLTQLTLGIDRDSELMTSHFDENNPAAKKMIAMAIEKANKKGIKIGLCGQAPSDFPEFASFLVNAGINSISFNPDALLQGIQNINKAETQRNKFLPVVSFKAKKKTKII
ncbi:MAG: phosphoenolpyruvate synthase [Bacteroidetes bacterium HGW-Bacteroidetes-2]|jgi:pyruvate,water dikinase|nr:MAG: phosphoenolpyruvate synthase [Bacteroidetes bacterium HGW-Bacteroidetes-2]